MEGACVHDIELLLNCQVQLREEDFEQSFSGPWNYIGVQQPKKKKTNTTGGILTKIAEKEAKAIPHIC